MNNDILVSTLPIKPQNKTNIGMLIAPLTTEIISKKIDSENIISLNLLHSYEDKDYLSNTYINDINKFGIKYNNIFLDKVFINKLKDYIKLLYEKKFIIEDYAEVLRCNCGKIDISLKGIRNYDNGDIYEKRDGSFFCKECGSLCKEIEEKGLYLDLSNNINDAIQIVPNFLLRDISYFHNNIRGNKLLISKKRDTGITFKTKNGNEYNIDIDLLWMNFIQCFNQDNQILVASNHQLYEMYILNYINNMISNKNICFVATPYMNKTNLNILKYFDTNDELYKKLCLLYSLKWKNKNCNYDESIFKCLNKVNDENKKILYDNITNKFTDINFSNIASTLNKCFMNDINIQKNLKLINKIGR